MNDRGQSLIMMDQLSLFSSALNLTPPWKVLDVNFSCEENRIDIWVGYDAGSTFTCPSCNEANMPIYDAKEKIWRHLNFFQYRTYVHARVPRISCSGSCGVKQVTPPWARPGSEFTLFFESLIMVLAREMPVRAVAKLTGEHDTRLWRILSHYVEAARIKQDFSAVQSIGVDETAAKRGHDYISLFVDLDTSRLLYATPGRGKDTVGSFAKELRSHNGDPDQIKTACCDLSPAFISGVSTSLPKAELIFDRFHVMKIINTAVDEVRRNEAQENDSLKKTRYIWLKNPRNLTKKQQHKLESLKYENMDTVRAYNLKLSFQEFFKQTDRINGEQYLKQWFNWATHSRLLPMVNAAYTVKDHWNGILSWITSSISNGVLEGTNSLLQAAKARARGYRNVNSLITMAYLISSKLDFALPTL
jgi:transposase